MQVEAVYPHSPLTGQVLPLTRQRVWSVAKKVRLQLVEDAWQRKLSPELLAGMAETFSVNGFSFAACWDLDHDVRDAHGKRVLGATEFDPAQPDSVMVSVNGRMLNGSSELLLSTIAHELGHVVFDAPGWIRSAEAAQAFGKGHEEPKSLSARHDEDEAQRWSEWRANEFMGALLTPSTLLRVDFCRLAKKHKLRASEQPSQVLRGAPAYDGWTVEPEVADEIVGSLAERFGVSDMFIAVRLSRYDLLRIGMQEAPF